MIWDRMHNGENPASMEAFVCDDPVFFEGLCGFELTEFREGWSSFAPALFAELCTGEFEASCSGPDVFYGIALPPVM